jgi:hypothetical protein
VLHVHDPVGHTFSQTWEEGMRVCVGLVECPDRCSPKDVHVKDLVPVVEAIPGFAIDTDPGIVQKHGDL